MIEQLNLKENPINERFRGYLPVIVDVETAGFDPQKNALLEIGAYFIDLNENGSFVVSGSLHYNIKPFEGAEINKDSVNFIGIDPFDPERDAMDEADAIKEFCKAVSKKVKENKCNRAIMVAHNAHFDHSFIMNAVSRHNYKRCPFQPLIPNHWQWDFLDIPFWQKPVKSAESNTTARKRTVLCTMPR